MAILPRPSIYEINTWLWLRELSGRYGESITLASVPAGEWDSLAEYGFDAVWLMGVWERSPLGLELALEVDALQKALTRAVPDWTPADVVGSPYCIRDYIVDPALGGPAGLAAARQELAARGMALILDFVSNHVAPDHAWVTEHPDYFIRGTAGDLAAEPGDYYKTGEVIVALGRDPYFPSWPDVVQLNAFSPELRRAAIDTLRAIASQCDGVRCDMAMLMTVQVFGRSWGERAGPPPAEEYWREVIPAVRKEHPDFCFIAEVYWGLESEMQAQGFDYCYDKRLYDYVAHGTPTDVREHLSSEPAYQDRLVRFIENHDEARAAAVFPAGRALAAAIAAYTLPGAKLFHQGQFEGYTVQLPVYLTRRPPSPVDGALRAFYRRLTNVIGHPVLRQGEWQLCPLSGWPDNTSHNNLVAWCWQMDGRRRLIVVNLSSHTSQARVQLPWPDLAGRNWLFEDVMDETVYERGGDEVLNMGLFVELAPWGRHFFTLR